LFGGEEFPMNHPWEHLPFEDSSPAVDRKAIAAASTKVKLPFPPDYVEFLLAHNGGTIGRWPRYPIEGCKRDTHGLLHVLDNVGDPERNDLVRKHKVFRRRMPTGLLPIASDPGGNQICLVCTGERAGQVVFWERAFEANTDEGEKVGWGNVYRIADSLGDFFRRLELDDE
jgi:cell wall assembly regulator SMI1